MDTIDLVKLTQALRGLPEERELAEKMELNGYLRDHLLPIFQDDRYPGLNELDFGQFERNDLCDLAAYIQESGRVEFHLMNLNEPLCLAPPKAARTRAFL